MIFNLGKNRSESTRSIEAETLKRWRDASGHPIEGMEAEVSGSASEPRSPSDNLASRTIDLKSEVVGGTDSWTLGDAAAPVIDSWNVDEHSESSSVQESFRLRAAALKAQTPEPEFAPITPPPVVEQPVKLVSKAEVRTETKSDRAPAGDPNLPPDEDIRRRFGAHLHSALGSGTVIEGKMRFDSPVRIDGTLDGEVVSTSTLIVGEQAVVRASLKVGSLIVLGQVDGNVEATDLIEIKKGGHLDGDITSTRFVVEDGGYFQGQCRFAG